jgi:hypothetical protein
LESREPRPCIEDKERIVTDKSVTQVDAAHAPRGTPGQRYLANGRALSMRLCRLLMTAD